MRLRSYVGGTALCLGLWGCGGGDGGVARTQAALTAAAPNDLTVGYIQRLPSLSWVQDSANPKVEGWPAVGQRVTWRGYIRNFSTVARAGVRYAWSWAGAQGATCAVDPP